MSSEARKITLKSSDEKEFEVEKAVAIQSEIIKEVIGSDCANSCIPLPNVDTNILVKVIEYCKKHAEASAIITAANAAAAAAADAAAAAAADLKSFDAEFVKVDLDTIFDLKRAANYLEIMSLHKLTCKAGAEMLKEKTTEEVFKILGLDEE